LEGRTLIVKSNPRINYAPGSVRAIRDEGMPQEANPVIRGNMYIIISVDFPKQLDDTSIRRIKKSLPKKTSKNFNADDDDLEVVTLKTVDINEERKRWKEERQQKNQYDSDDDEPRRGHTAQCQTQ